MSYEAGLQADPKDPSCTKGLSEVKKAMDDSPENPFGPGGMGGDMGLGKMFSDPGLIPKLYAHPKTKEAMKDPSFVAKVQQLQRGGGGFGADMLSDPRMLTVLGVAMGVDIVSWPLPKKRRPRAGGGGGCGAKADILGCDGKT